MVDKHLQLVNSHGHTTAKLLVMLVTQSNTNTAVVETNIKQILGVKVQRLTLSHGHNCQIRLPQCAAQ